MSELALRTIRVTEAAPPRSGFVPASLARLSVSAVAGSNPDANAGLPQEPAVDHYAQGFEDGRRAAEDSFVTERKSLLQLVETANALQAEPSEELATLIGETVYRLVTDIVGAVEIDRACLHRRAIAAAELIAECDNARTLHVHPDDLPLLVGLETSLTIAGDASLSRGDIRIDCSAGWIEHGTSLYLDALRTELGLEGEVQ